MTRKSFLSVLAIAVFMAFAVASSEDNNKYEIVSETLELDHHGRYYLLVKIKNTGDNPIRFLELKYSLKASDGTSETVPLYFKDVQPGDIAQDDAGMYNSGKSASSFKRLEE